MANSTVCVLPRTIMPADEPLGERGGDRRHAVGPHLRSAGGDASFEIDEVFERDGTP